MSRPVFKFAVALLILLFAVLLWFNWREILDWICETLHIYELADSLGLPGCFDPNLLKL